MDWWEDALQHFSLVIISHIMKTSCSVYYPLFQSSNEKTMLFVGKIFSSPISSGRQQKELFVATHCYLRIPIYYCLYWQRQVFCRGLQATKCVTQQKSLITMKTVLLVLSVLIVSSSILFRLQSWWAQVRERKLCFPAVFIMAKPKWPFSSQLRAVGWLLLGDGGFLLFSTTAFGNSKIHQETQLRQPASWVSWFWLG